MKLFTYLLTFLFIVNTLFADELKEEQIKVAYVYNFMKNITWQNEQKLEKYRLLVASKNATLLSRSDCLSIFSFVLFNIFGFGCKIPDICFEKLIV
mgnify:CR=1 FL=1